MSRAKRILLIGGVLVMSVSAAEARLWGRNADKPAATASQPGAIVLTAVEVDGSQVVLRTNGAPAYTSYSPSPGVFVIDLTGTSRDASAVVPFQLPPAVTSLTADEVVEMGTKLTRVTLRFAESVTPEISAIDKGVVITVPATVVPIETAAPSAVEVLPAVIARNDPEPAPEMVSEPAVREEAPDAQPTRTEPVAELRPEPVAETQQSLVLPRARAVRSISASSATGQVEVRIAGDGELKYNAFRLEGPSRLVIDLEGVRNSVTKNTVDVSDDIVKRVRIAQFQPTVARVVVDLVHMTQWEIKADGESLRVLFPESGVASRFVPESAPEPRPAPAMVAEVPKPVPPVVSKAAPAPVVKPVAVADDLPASVPTIAENAPAWKMPEPASPKPASRGAHKVINAPADQAPPVSARPQPQEDVFSSATVPVQTALPQNLSGARTLSAGPRVFNGEPLSLNLKDADIRDVLRTFADLTGLNMAIDPGVSGSVTVDFVDVPWDQALDIILRQNSLTYTLEGNVMRIGTVERIAAETAASRRLAEEERLNVPLATLSFKLSYARAADVSSLLKDIASPRARILMDPRTNQLVISEVPVYLQTMQNLIATVDIPNRQVMIEARIVESQRTFRQQWGVDLDFGGLLDPAVGTGTGLVFPNRVGFRGGPFNFGGAAAPVLTLNFLDVLGVFDLDVTLRAAESAGYIKVVSAPRVTTQDNTAAEIQSGFQIPYQTRINFTTTVTYLDATLRLSVTPQITEAGTVIMDIQVQKNEPAEGLAIDGAAGTPLTTRRASTRLMVRDGGTAVIAGIFQTRDNSGQSRVPVLHQIPIIGALFKTHIISTDHDELLIFITPRIVRL
ncbi:MAG: type IV pilus secretin PilQ [Acidobacteriota bacterium]